MAAVGEGLLDGFGHEVLAGAMLEGEGGFGEEAAGVEEVVEGWEFLLGGGVAGWGIAIEDGREWRHPAVLMIIAVSSPGWLPWDYEREAQLFVGICGICEGLAG